jgi:hypothetical protein
MFLQPTVTLLSCVYGGVTLSRGLGVAALKLSVDAYSNYRKTKGAFMLLVLW